MIKTTTREGLLAGSAMGASITRRSIRSRTVLALLLTPTLVAPMLVTPILAPSAEAATFTVNNTADSGPGSLRAALASAGSSDIIVVDPSLTGQTINLSSPLTASAPNLTVIGNGVRLGGNANPLFSTGSGVVDLQNLIVSGNAGAAGAVGTPGDASTAGGSGGAGMNGGNGAGGSGSTITNSGTISGGAGGNGGDGGSDGGANGGIGGNGGNGGSGVSGSSLTITNRGTIAAGSGGNGGLGLGGGSPLGGNGGIGIDSSGASITNRGTVSGGDGGSGGHGGGTRGGDGGAGISGNGSTIANNGTISGGNGGYGGSGGSPNGGNAGAGISGSGLTITNDGTIRGGTGGNGNNAFTGHDGSGGAGISGSNLTITNRGTIAGGDKGWGGVSGGVSGAGISGANLSIINSGTISGGYGGNAITFTGGTNRLELQAGFNIADDVVAVSGGTDILAFGGATNSSFDLSLLGVQYQNFAALAKTGTGTWVLSGDGSGFTGTTTVDGGTLVVGDAAHPGTQLGGDATVNAAGTLAGHGTVTGNVDNVAGIVSPGGSIGTLSVGGNYSQGSSSTLRIEVSPNAASQLAVGGTAALGGTLNLVFTPGVYRASTYTVVTAAGGLGGTTFGTVTQNGGRVFNGITYDLNTVMLGINNGAVGGSLVVAPSNGQIIGTTSVSMVQGAQAANRALFGHLSDKRGGGSSDDNLRTAFSGSNSNQIAFAGDLAGLNAVLASLPQELAQQGGWFRATGGFGSIDGSGGVPGVDSHGGGFMAGYDYQLTDHFLLGAAVGYSRTQLEQDDGSNSTVNTPRVTLYGSYQAGAFALDGSLGYGYDRIKTNNVSDGGVATSQHDAHEIVAGLQASYAVDLPQKVVLTPRAGLDYLHLFEQGFKESGAGGFDLTTESGDMDSLRPSVGVSMSREFVTDGGTTLTPQLDLTYSREVLDNGRNAQVLVGGGAFTVAGVKPSRDQLTLGASLTASLTQSFDLFGGYTALLPVGNTISHNFEAGLRVSF